MSRLKNLILLVFISILVYNNKYFDLPESTNVEISECTPAQIEMERFLNDMAFSESSNRYNIVSKRGYLGKYQFSYSTLKGIGYDITKKEFLSNPILQDEAMIDLLKYNKQILQKYIDKWDGRIYNGVKITESGILAAAHLTGAGSVKKYFRYGLNTEDANGTSITDYMSRFYGYKLEI